MMCFLWQHEIYLWYLSGTAYLYSGPCSVDLACLRNHLRHACRYWYCGCHRQDNAVWRDRTHYSFSSIRAVVYGFSSNIRSKLVDLRRIILVFICIFVRLVRTRTRMIRCGLLYYILLVTGVRAVPKYSYSYNIICVYVRIVTFNFSLKVFHYFFLSRYLVVGSRYDSFIRFQ